MKDKAVFKKALPDLLVLVAFIVISFVYFSTAVMDGRKLSQHDSLAAIGQGQESREYMEQNDGERTRWQNSMFGGMPTYQIGPSYNSTKPIDAAKQAYQLFLPNYVYLVFIMMLGFYILMRALKANYLVSALGAIIWAFSSYFFIIIAAGHLWKFITLAYIPPTIAGMILIYRRKYWTGAFLVMVFVAFQLSSNHIQMSYYFMIVMIAIALAYLVEAIKKKQLGVYAKSTGVLIIAGLIGVTANISSLYHTYEYSKETMRGKSELSHHGAENKTDAGLERDYITAWSYGVGETFTLLVPNTKGGASVPLAQNHIAMKKARPEYRELYSQIGQYWGDQPGTSGPVYAGALVMMLFVLGLFIVKGPMKWALLGATILSIMLSWGKNFMGLTDFFIDYVPMYNKFRTVSSILVVAEFTIPLLAALAVKEMVLKPQILRDNMRPLFYSVGLTAGVALLFSFFPCADDLNAMSFALLCSTCPEITEVFINSIHGAEIIAVYVVISRHGDFPSFRRSPYHEATIFDGLVFFRLAAILPCHTHSASPFFLPTILIPNLCRAGLALRVFPPSILSTALCAVSAE